MQATSRLRRPDPGPGRGAGFENFLLPSASFLILLPTAPCGQGTARPVFLLVFARQRREFVPRPNQRHGPPESLQPRSGPAQLPRRGPCLQPAPARPREGQQGSKKSEQVVEMGKNRIIWGPSTFEGRRTRGVRSLRSFVPGRLPSPLLMPSASASALASAAVAVPFLGAWAADVRRRRPAPGPFKRRLPVSNPGGKGRGKRDPRRTSAAGFHWTGWPRPRWALAWAGGGAGKRHAGLQCWRSADRRGCH
jgi:hypothetical protein